MYTLPRDLAEVGDHYLPRHFTVLRSVGTVGLPVTQPMPLLLQKGTQADRDRGASEPDPLGLGHEEVSESESKRTGREI